VVSCDDLMDGLTADVHVEIETFHAIVTLNYRFRLLLRGATIISVTVYMICTLHLSALRMEKKAK
jgi:hypothetical protein